MLAHNPDRVSNFRRICTQCGFCFSFKIIIISYQTYCVLVLDGTAVCKHGQKRPECGTFIPRISAQTPQKLPLRVSAPDLILTLHNPKAKA